MARTRTWTAAAAKVERERTRELARIGSNLNQIARWANAHKGNTEAVEVECKCYKQNEPQQERDRGRGPERDYGPSR